jgi:hypothetical protein
MLDEDEARLGQPTEMLRDRGLADVDDSHDLAH